MLGVRVHRREAEAVRRKLVEEGVLVKEYHPLKDGECIVFPVSRRVEGLDVVEAEFRKRETKPRNLREALAGVLSPEEMDALVTSFDIIGDVAVINIPPELWEKRKTIGEAVLRVHPNVRVVAAEKGAHEGVFRVQPVEVIAGEGPLVTRYVEHGVPMWLEVGKTYFSPRLSYERARIASLVQPGEVIAAFFAGVGPFPLVIAKKQPLVKRIYAIELNPHAYTYLVRNVKENGLDDVVLPILGDVRAVAPKIFHRNADRVLMPLPKGAYTFLDVAMDTVKPGGVVHFYHFAPEEDLYGEAEELVKRAAEEKGREAEIIDRRKVRPFAPRVYQVVLDVRVT